MRPREAGKAAERQAGGGEKLPPPPTLDGGSIFFSNIFILFGGCVENTPVNAGDSGDLGSIPGSGRSPGGGHGNPLQYSCLENSMDREAWRATIHGVAKSQT